MTYPGPNLAEGGEQSFESFESLLNQQDSLSTLFNVLELRNDE